MKSPWCTQDLEDQVVALFIFLFYRNIRFNNVTLILGKEIEVILDDFTEIKS